MSTEDIKKTQEPQAQMPEYEPPEVVTHRGEELLEELGPAQACSFNHSVVGC
jgi:hypothetical protein